MFDWALFCGILIGLLGIAITIYLAMRGFRNEISDRLHEIDRNTEPIVEINKTILRLDEFVRSTLHPGGTVEGKYKNLGKVQVTASPGPKETRYDITIENPILDQAFILKKSQETELINKEKELFGEESTVNTISPVLVIWRLPSTDPKICTEFVRFLLNWLDTTYVESVKEDKNAFERGIMDS